MNLKWIEPTEVQNSPRVKTKYESLTYTRRVAAVNIETDQIINIFDNVMKAARVTLSYYYSEIQCNEDTVRYAAKKIAEAAEIYHKECLGFYWKYIY